MAQAQVTVKLAPAELAVIQEALMNYKMGLKGDDTGTIFRRSVSGAILAEIGMGLPEAGKSGTKQLSFVAETTEDYELEEVEPVEA